MSDRRPIAKVLVMGGTLGSEILTITSLLLAVAYGEPSLLTYIALMKGNPTILAINSIWLVFLSLWAVIKITLTVGAETNKLLIQVVGPWTRSSPESS